MNIGRKLNQTAVYWAPGAAGGDGNRAYDAAVEVAVRWQNKRVEFTNAAGKKDISQAIIYFDGAGTTILLGGRIFLGELTDLTVAEQADPRLVDLSYQVKANDLSPSLNASQSLRKAIL